MIDVPLMSSSANSGGWTTVIATAHYRGTLYLLRLRERILDRMEGLDPGWDVGSAPDSLPRP